MDRCGIQWIRSVSNPHEARRLFKGFRAKTTNLMKFDAGFEWSVGITMCNNMGRKFWTDTCNMRKQSRTGSVDIYTDAVDHALNHAVQRVCQSSLIHVMLVHAHTDGFGIDLDQLGQRILGAACNGYRTANRDIQIGEFRTGKCGCRVNGCSRFVDDQIFGLPCIAS